MCTARRVTRSYPWRSLPKGGSPLTTERYLICSPTIALFLEDGRHVAHLVPEGAMISFDGKTFNGNKLIEVTWAERIVMMFTQDLRTRGKKVD
jgi:hypothetical protein